MNEHLKAIYKNLFESIKHTRTQTKIKTDSLQEKLNDTIYENAKLREKLFGKFSEQNVTVKGTSANTKFAKPLILGIPPLQPFRNQSVVRLPTVSIRTTKITNTRSIPKIGEAIDLTKPGTSHSVPKTQESKVAKNANVIALGMFRINPLKNSKEDTFVPNNQVKASVRTKPITVIQPRVNTKKHVNSNINGLSSTRIDNTAKTRRVEPWSMNQMTRNWPTHKCSYVTKTYVPKAEHSRSSSSFSDSKCFICSTCQKCVFNENHDACIINLLKVVNSHTKIQSNNTTKRYISIEKKSYAKKPERHISARHKFFPNKTFVVYVKMMTSNNVTFIASFIPCFLPILYTYCMNWYLIA
ncbi:hypothetical protein Tco_1009213 [Tanacetum coccineum]